MDEVISDRENEDEDALQRERRARRQAERRVAALEASVSYRLGHAIVLSVTRPLAAIKRLVAFLFRQVYRRLSHETRRRLLGWGEDHLPAGVMRRARSLNRTLKPGSADRPRSSSQPSRQPPARTALLSNELPVHGYLLFGVEDLELRRLVRSVRMAALVHGDHVPLIITDSLAFGHLRAEHVAFEYVPGPEQWDLTDPATDWGTFLRSRLAHLRATHDLDQSFVVAGDHRLTDAMLAV